MIYIRKKLTVQAVHVLQDLVARAPDNPAYHLHLAMALYDTGEKEAAKKGTRILVVDPRRPDIADFATWYCRINPGTDVAFYNAVMNVLIGEDLVNHRFIAERTEHFDALREVVRAAREAGATGIWANLLFLRPGTREHFLEHLAEDWPEQLPLYARLYARRRAYLGAEERNPLRDQVGALSREYGIRDRRKLKLAPPPEPEQLSLSF